MKQIIFMDRNSGDWRPRSWTSHLVGLRARLACRPMTHLIAISDFIRRRLIRLGIAPTKITRVYLGVELERFAPDPEARAILGRELGFGPEDLVVASVMQLLPRKNPAVLVEACGLLAKRGVPIRLLVAGDGPLHSELEELGHTLGIGDRVHWLGHQARPERAMQAADLFVLTSVGEAFGLVLAEAMACGLPIVGSNSGAIPEIVEDGKTGFLVPPLSPEGFADAIDKLAHDASLRLRMGAAGRRRAQQLFSVESHVRHMLEVYEAIWRQRAWRPRQPTGSLAQASDALHRSGRGGNHNHADRSRHRSRSGMVWGALLVHRRRSGRGRGRLQYGRMAALGMAPERPGARLRSPLNAGLWRQLHRRPRHQLLCAGARQAPNRPLLGRPPARPLLTRLPALSPPHGPDQCANRRYRHPRLEPTHRLTRALPPGLHPPRREARDDHDAHGRLPDRHRRLARAAHSWVSMVRGQYHLRLAGSRGADRTDRGNCGLALYQSGAYLGAISVGIYRRDPHDDFRHPRAPMGGRRRGRLVLTHGDVPHNAVAGIFRHPHGAGPGA